MSCNGCRVLRKGCSESCILRPCLQWIESADAQGHATVFVAKFFGRSGLMGFIGAVPPNQRPAVFQSLLYEACGRTVNPVFGAVGLLWAGNWAACQSAVETVLKGGSLRPPSPSAFGDGGISSFPSLAAGAPFPTPPRQERCPTEASGLALANEKSDTFKKVREVMMEGLHTARCGPNGTHQTQMQSEKVESRAPEMNGDSAEVNRQWAWSQESNQSLPFRLDLSHVQLARAGCIPKAAKEEHVEDRRTDGPLVLVPVARRVRPRTEMAEVRPVGRGRIEMMDAARMQTIPNLEREQLELDLTLSSNVAAPRHHRSGHAPKGVKRVSSPNSSESVNSEGSVTSLDSTCDLSLSQVPPVWKFQKRENCLPFSPPICPNVRKALTLFASP